MTTQHSTSEATLPSPDPKPASAEPKLGGKGDGLRLRDLSWSVLRANPRYAFAPFSELPPGQRELLGDLESGKRYGGILRETGAGNLRIQAISPAVAQIFAHLSRARTADSVPFAGTGTSRDRLLAGLVLDGVLEVETKPGSFTSRAASYLSLVEADADLIGRGRLAGLSLDALRHGDRMTPAEPAGLAARIYSFNRLPATQRWLGLWPDRRAVRRFLGIDPGGKLQRQLSAHLSDVNAEAGMARWIVWNSHQRRQRRSAGGGKHKLYVSVLPDGLAAAFAAVVRLLPHRYLAAMKVGCDAHGLLRPDKFMLYFDRQDELEEFADALLPALDGLEAHGVPFSAALDDAGMLSWGVDPSAEEGSVSWYQDDSFRIWVCNRLATALVDARQFPAEGVPAWRYALARLSLSGLDTRTWSPRLDSAVASEAAQPSVEAP